MLSGKILKFSLGRDALQIHTLPLSYKKTAKLPLSANDSSFTSTASRIGPTGSQDGFDADSLDAGTRLIPFIGILINAHRHGQAWKMPQCFVCRITGSSRHGHSGPCKEMGWLIKLPEEQAKMLGH